jgi:hypothetical protein
MFVSSFIAAEFLFEMVLLNSFFTGFIFCYLLEGVSRHFYFI